jgi:hypothetical protein
MVWATLESSKVLYAPQLTAAPSEPLEKSPGTGRFFEWIAVMSEKPFTHPEPVNFSVKFRARLLFVQYTCQRGKSLLLQVGEWKAPFTERTLFDAPVSQTDTRTGRVWDLSVHPIEAGPGVDCAFTFLPNQARVYWSTSELELLPWNKC